MYINKTLLVSKACTRPWRFLTITSILTIFYRWSIYLERNEALKSFETIKLAEEHRREQLAKHGLENSHDRAPSFHQLQSSSAAKIKEWLNSQYMTTPSQYYPT